MPNTTPAGETYWRTFVPAGVCNSCIVNRGLSCVVAVAPAASRSASTVASMPPRDACASGEPIRTINAIAAFVDASDLMALPVWGHGLETTRPRKFLPRGKGCVTLIRRRQRDEGLLRNVTAM